MRISRAALALLIAGVVHADCRYFRTEYSVDSCKALPAAAVPASTSTVDLPGLEETPTGPLDEVKCECSYSLSGGNPLCDTERVQEFSQAYPQDPATPNCPRARSLCAELCPRQIH